eukprot:scaffold280037_cov13-Tisochrysis_lutea.AAC.1
MQGSRAQTICLEMQLASLQAARCNLPGPRQPALEVQAARTEAVPCSRTHATVTPIQLTWCGISSPYFKQ